MLKKSYVGILSILSLIVLIIMLILMSGLEMTMPATYLKITAVALVSTIIYSALFAIRSFDPTYNPKTFKIYTIVGTILTLISIFVIFNYLPFSTSWNWLIAGVVLFTTIAGLEIMDWYISKNLLVRFAGILLIISAGFITLIFITLWKSHLLRLWLDVATLTAFVSMAAGIIFARLHANKQKNPTH